MFTERVAEEIHVAKTSTSLLPSPLRILRDEPSNQNICIKGIQILQIALLHNLVTILVLPQVDMVIHALDHERAFWTDTQFVRRLSQRRAVGGINRRTIDIDTRLR